MYYFSKYNTRGIYFIGPEGRERLAAMAATGAESPAIASFSTRDCKQKRM
jgi:hypothetical protein